MVSGELENWLIWGIKPHTFGVRSIVSRNSTERALAQREGQCSQGLVTPERKRKGVPRRLAF